MSMNNYIQCRFLVQILSPLFALTWMVTGMSLLLSFPSQFSLHSSDRHLWCSGLRIDGLSPLPSSCQNLVRMNSLSCWSLAGEVTTKTCFKRKNVILIWYLLDPINAQRGMGSFSVKTSSQEITKHQETVGFWEFVFFCRCLVTLGCLAEE